MGPLARHSIVWNADQKGLSPDYQGSKFEMRGTAQLLASVGRVRTGFVTFTTPDAPHVI